MNTLVILDTNIIYRDFFFSRVDITRLLEQRDEFDYEVGMLKFIFNEAAKKYIEISAQRYFIDALGSMAQGLFASLLIGTILNTIGQEFNIPFLSETVWPIANSMTGSAIGVAGLMLYKRHPWFYFHQ